MVWAFGRALDSEYSVGVWDSSHYFNVQGDGFALDAGDAKLLTHVANWQAALLSPELCHVPEILSLHLIAGFALGIGPLRGKRSSDFRGLNLQ